MIEGQQMLGTPFKDLAEVTVLGGQGSHKIFKCSNFRSSYFLMQNTHAKYIKIQEFPRYTVLGSPV